MAIKRPRLKLTKGKTYTFDVSDSDLSNHPFKFTADSGTSEYTTGVTLTGTQGQAGASISFNISDSAPSNMNYYCGTHGLGMGNHIVIADAPASGGGGGGTSLNVNNLDTYPTAFKPISYFGLILKFNGDGTAFTWWYQTQNMEWWDLSTPWDLSTATKNNTKSQTPNNILDANGFVYFDYNSDGTKLLSYSYDNPEPKVGLKEWSLSTAYDPNSHGVSPSTNSSITSATFNAGNPKTYSSYNQIQWIDSGNKVALTEGSTEGVNFYNATTAYDLTTIDFTSPSSTHTSVGYPNYISAKNWWFSDDGLSAYTASPHANSSVRVTQCSMSSPWDLSTLTVVAEKELGTFNGGPGVMTHVDDIHVEPSQGKLYLTAYGGVDSDGVEWNDGTGTYQNTKAWIGEWQFNSKNPFDLSTSFFINAIKAYGADSDVNTYSSYSTELSGDFNDPEAMATNGKYTLLSDANIMINHSGPGSTGNSIIAGSGGWTWLVRNSDGALMKSWNGLISDYDHNLLDLETYYIGAGGGTPYYSKYHTCNWGKQVAMNDNFMFIGCGYRPTGGSNTSLNWSDDRAFIFVYDIEPPHNLRKVWKLEDFVATSLPHSSSVGYTGGGTGFMEQNFTLTNDELFVPAAYCYWNNTTTDGGRVVFWDISDPDPANWSTTPDAVINNPLNPVSNPIYMNWNNTGNNYSNKNFGQNGVAYGHNRMVVGHGVYMHTFTRNGNTFTHNSDVVVGPYRTYSYEPYASFTNDAANPRLLNFGYGTAGSNTTREIRLLDPANNLSADWTVDLNAPSTSGYPWGARPLTVGKDVKVELFSYGDAYKNNKAGHIRFLKLSDQSQILDLDNPLHRDSDGLYFGDNYAIGPIDSAGSNKYSLVSWGEPDDVDSKDIISFNILQWDSDTGSLFLQGNPPASASATGFINQTNSWTVAGGTGTVNQTNTYNLGNGITQAADKSYYITGEVNSKSGWLAKFNESGVFQWAREYGTYYLRSEDVITDNANNVYVVGSDYGYGENFAAGGGTYSPQLLYISKFNDAGTRQWSKVLRYNNITDNAASTYTNHVEIDSHGNLWMLGSINWTATGLNSQTNVLYKVDSSGALGGVWYLPSSVAANNSPQGLMIDENDNMYITFTQYQSNGSYPHGVVAKMSIPGATGSPTYTWVKEYGITSNAAYYDVPYGVMKSSDGNLIVFGYSDDGGAGNGNYTSIMKLNDTNGDFIWKKLYDQTYGNGPINATIDANDNIYITSETNNAGYTHYYFWMRQIDASDGSTKKVYEIDFTGTANNGSVWRFETQHGSRGLRKNRDGNLMMLMSPNGNASGSYEQALIKFPATISAGTFGKLVITETTPTTTDPTYNATDQTYASYSTVTSVGGQFQTDNYNAGTYNDTVYTPTLTEDLDTIT